MQTPGGAIRQGFLACWVCLSQLQLSGLFQLSCLLAFALPVVLQLEADAVALVQRPHPGRLDRRGVHEHVLPALVGGDEAEALGAVEELDRSGDSHVVGSLLKCVQEADSR